VQEKVGQRRGGKYKSTSSRVAGGSKRGWTTWCTAAVDKRVAAIVPARSDCLTTALRWPSRTPSPASTRGRRRHVRKERRKTPIRGEALHAIRGSYSYRDRSRAQVIVNAAGDKLPSAPPTARFISTRCRESTSATCRTRPWPQSSDARQSVGDVLSHDPQGRTAGLSWTFEGLLDHGRPAAYKIGNAVAGEQSRGRDFRLMTMAKRTSRPCFTGRGGGNHVAKLASRNAAVRHSFVEWPSTSALPTISNVADGPTSSARLFEAPGS